jgi:cellulose synthase (UDP-forming)
MDFFYGRTREPFFSEIYESVQAMFLIPAVISVILNPSKPSFKVTPKGTTQSEESLNSLAIVLFVAIAVNVLAVVIGVFKWFSEPLLRDTLIITGVWCAYNLFLMIISLGAFWERKQIRLLHRVTVKESVKVFFPRLNLELAGEVGDISLKGMGFRVQVPYPLVSQERVVLEIKNSQGRVFQFEAKLQRIFERDGRYNCGAEFMLDHIKYAEAVAFVYGDSKRWLGKWAERSNSGGVVKLLWCFFILGIKGFNHSAMTLWLMARKLWQECRRMGLAKTIRRVRGAV